jgi:beta-fructofuranosidase
MTIQANSPFRQTISAQLNAGTVIHLWLKARLPDYPASLAITVGGGAPLEVTARQTEEFEFGQATLPAGGHAELSYDPATTAVSVIYAFEPATVMDDGVTVLHHMPDNAPPALTAGYHFRPPFGWMNDPNGFGRFGGRLHLFYQHYPHGLRWNNMHWGHAVSNDFIHWRHLPVFLFPSTELSVRNDGRGGAFSGSAIPIAGPNRDEIRVFFTEQVSSRRPEEQIQLTALCRDGVSVGRPAVVLPARPEGLELTLDFRDPYVFKGPDGLWKMLLGSRDRAGGIVLIYETDDQTGAIGWTFVGVLHREDRFGMTAAECPCMVPIDGPADDPSTRWGLIFGLLTSRDPATGRRNLTIVTVGRFDGRHFAPEFEQEFDFGSDAYAFQSFVDRDGPIGIAWLANWTDISRKADFPTAMTLPRRLALDGDTLLTPPVAAVEGLRHDMIDDVALRAGQPVPLADGAVEIVIELSTRGAAFTLKFDHPDVGLGLQLGPDGLEILYDPGSGNPSPRYIATGATPSKLRVFLDAGSIEVFADNGRWTGTKRITSFATAHSARLLAPPGNIAAARIWQLKL